MRSPLAIALPAPVAELLRFRRSCGFERNRLDIAVHHGLFVHELQRLESEATDPASVVTGPGVCQADVAGTDLVDLSSHVWGGAGMRNNRES